MARQFDYLGDVEAFLAVVDQGSFTAAAVQLATTPSVLSRAVTRLETRLGQQLLRRSTRSIGLTDAGRRYREQTRAAFTQLEDAGRELLGDPQHVTGRVRLSVPTTYGHYRLPAVLARFSAHHRQVQVEVNISNRNVDLVAEGFDLAVRLGELPDSGLVAHRLEEAALCLVASPDYLRRAGVPQALDDLRQHRCLPFVMPSSGRIAAWALRDQGGDVEWSPPAALTVSDDVLGVVSLAAAGLGICQSYDFIVGAAIARGELVEVLPALRGRSRPFSVVYAPHRRQSAASRALVEALRAG